MTSEAVDLIKRSVSMRDVLQHYGLEVNRAGYCNCPFHNEKTASMKVYDNGFFCFGCQTGGDVISFTMQYTGLDFKGACAELATAFNLNIDCEPTEAHRRELTEKQTEANLNHLLTEAYTIRLHKLQDVQALYVRWIEEYRPGPGADFDSRYCEAVRNIDLIDYELMSIQDALKRVRSA